MKKRNIRLLFFILHPFVPPCLSVVPVPQSLINHTAQMNHLREGSVQERHVRE